MQFNSKPRLIAVALTSLFLLGMATVAKADSTDDLLKKLHDKGILNDQEYDDFNSTRDTEKVKKLSELKTSFKDGIVFESGDKSFQAQINGRVQLDYRDFVGGSDAQNLDQMDVRRAYLGVKGKIYNDYDFNVTADFAQGQNAAATGTNQLDVAYFGINWWEFAKFRFGQFDMPFGMEHLTSDLFTDFMERSFTDQVSANKERGAQIWGTPFKGSTYALAVSTGRGKNDSNKDQSNEGVDLIGRATVNFAEIFSVQDAVLHVGGEFSHGYLSENQAANGTSGGSTLGAGLNKAYAGATEPKGIGFFAPTSWSTVLSTNDVERTRGGLEGAASYGPVKFQTEWDRVNYEGNGQTVLGGANTHFDKDIDTWYVAANWLVTGESYADTYKDGLWGRIRPKNDFIPGSGGLGAFQLGARYSEFDASDFKVGNGPGSVTNNAAVNGVVTSAPTGAHAWTLGGTWIINPQTRLMVNYTETTFEGGSVRFTDSAGLNPGLTNKEKALSTRASFDF